MCNDCEQGTMHRHDDKPWPTDANGELVNPRDTGTYDAELLAWLNAGGYPSVDAWAEDSDYHYNADRGEWYDDDDNWVDPEGMAFAAMESEQGGS